MFPAGLFSQPVSWAFARSGGCSFPLKAQRRNQQVKLVMDPPVLLGRTSSQPDTSSAKLGEASGATPVQCRDDLHRWRRREDGRKHRPWKWRCFQWSCSLIVVALSIWLAFASAIPVEDLSKTIEEELIPEANLKDDARFLVLALVVSTTALSGLTAIWMWLAAPTSHILMASHFLMLNWLEGLIMIHLLVVIVGWLWLPSDKSSGEDIDLFLRYYVPVGLRGIFSLGELVSLQYLAQHRLNQIWPALQRPKCGKWMARSFWLEVCLMVPSIILHIWACQILASCENVHYGDKERDACHENLQHFFSASLWVVCLVLGCFLIWFLLLIATLCRCTCILQRSFRFEKKCGRTHAASPLWNSLRAILLQTIGVVAGLFTTLAVSFVFICLMSFQFALTGWFGLLVTGQCVNSMANVAGVILLSGAFRLIGCRESPPPLGFRESICKPRRCCFRWCRLAPCGSRPRKNDKGAEWEAKTEELAGRGMTLKEIMAFYRQLGTVMVPFQPELHTTNDVVRLAIIPLTASSGCSYAELINQKAQVVPTKMVTHNWSNLFRDLVASVVADALDEHIFGMVAEMLSDSSGAQLLEEMLMEHGCLEKTYWICAFAVNQHISICGSNPRGDVDPVTMIPHPICSCAAPKIFNETPPLNAYGESIDCEMNKFDDMMTFLSRKNPSFAEVVAVDASMDLFNRAWCIAELAEAHRMGMPQCLKIRNKEALARRQHTLEDLKVENMTASRPKDKEEILRKIGDTNKFNRKLQALIFDKDVGLLTAWKKTDAVEQMEEVSRVLKWARLSQSVKDGEAFVWQRWVE